MPDLEAARLRLVPSDGEIACPKKGQIAVGRCLQLQAETTAEGRPCTCPVFRARQGSLPKLEVIVDDAPGVTIEQVVSKHTAPKPPPPKAPDRKALIAAAAAKKAAQPKETNVAKENICTGCGKSGSQSRRVYNGLCKACRAKEAKPTAAAGGEPARTPPPMRAERPVPRSASAGEGKIDQALERAARVTELRLQLAEAEAGLLELLGGA